MNFESRNLPAQTMQHCIDADTDKLMNSMGGGMRKDVCSKQDVQRVGNTIVVDSVCKFGPDDDLACRRQRRLQQRLHGQGHSKREGRRPGMSAERTA